MSMTRRQSFHAIYLPFVLFLITTMVVWQIWGKSLTLLMLSLILGVIFVRDNMARRRFSE